jgi:hypothetical protein
MGVRVEREMNAKPALEVLDKAGLKDEIKSMKGFDLRDPAQSVQAQEKLDQLLPKINQAFEDAGMGSHELTRLSYKDPNSGDTIQTDLGKSGGMASLNSVISAYAKQDAPKAVAAPGAKQAPPAPNQP